MIRLEKIVMIHDLKRQGLSVSAIARQTGLDRKTVRKHLADGVKASVYKPRPPRPRELEASHGTPAIDDDFGLGD